MFKIANHNARILFHVADVMDYRLIRLRFVRN